MVSEELLEPLLRRLRLGMIRPHLKADCIVLDLGCGAGHVLRTLSPYIRRGIGLDRKARQCRRGNTMIYRYDLCEPIPLPSGSVDLVLLLAVLEHLEEPLRVLGESYRVLRADGRLLLTTPAPVSRGILEFLSYRLGIVSPEEIRDHKHYYTREEIRTLLEYMGYKKIRVESFELGFNNMAIGVKA